MRSAAPVSYSSAFGIMKDVAKVTGRLPGELVLSLNVQSRRLMPETCVIVNGKVCTDQRLDHVAES